MAGMKVEIGEETIERVKRFRSAIDEFHALEPGCEDWEKAWDEYQDAKSACAVELLLIVILGGDHAGS